MPGTYCGNPTDNDEVFTIKFNGTLPDDYSD